MFLWVYLGICLCVFACLSVCLGLNYPLSSSLTSQQQAIFGGFGLCQTGPFFRTNDRGFVKERERVTARGSNLRPLWSLAWLLLGLMMYSLMPTLAF